MLKELGSKRVKLAVLSNKPHRQTVKVTEAVFGKDTFDMIMGQQEGILRKPSPEGLWNILDKLEVKREECLYVGDSEVDIVTGSNAGIETVSAAWGFRTEKELKEAGALRLIYKPSELLKYLR